MELTQDTKVNLAKALGVLEAVKDRCEDTYHNEIKDYETEIDFVLGVIKHSLGLQPNHTAPAQYRVERVRDYGSRKYGIINGDGKPIKQKNGIPLLFEYKDNAEQKATLLNNA